MDRQSQRQLCLQLKGARQKRGLSVMATAALFGAGPFFYLKWESGMRPIPPGIVPLMERWIASGAAPTAAELEQASPTQIVLTEDVA